METAWEATRRIDTVAAYNQYLRDNPESANRDEAQERMSYLRVRTYKTIDAYEEFVRRYPESALLPDLRDVVEELYFRRARLQNSAEAYRDFLQAYPDGKLASKAQGNLAYVSDVARAPGRDALERFIAAHPQSDFVPEAEKTLWILDLRDETRIQRLGVRVDVAPNVMQPARVRSGFASLVAKYYREHGVEITVMPADGVPGDDLDGWVRVDYREAPTSSAFGGSNLYALCRVRVYQRDVEEPIWDRSFEAPAEHIAKGAYSRDRTVFGNSNYAFWEGFFVPVSTWAVSKMRVNALDYLEAVRAIHVLGDSAALLLERGGVDFLDVSSPFEVNVRERYRREVDLSTWRGVRMLNDELAITFGNDGAEVIRRSDQRAERLARFEPGQVGQVSGAVLFDDATLLISSNKGLFAVRMNRAPLVPQALLDGAVIGVERRGEWVYVVRPDRIEAAKPEHLILHITAARAGLGRDFKALRVKRQGDSLFVFGDQRVIEVSLASAGKPRPVAVIEHQEVGPLADLAASGDHLYLLGERGLQIADPNGRRVEDFVQVGASRAVAMKGRFGLLVGESSVEVLDLSPYAEPEAAPASVEN